MECTHYADHAQVLRTSVIENVQLARDTWRVRFAAPDIARQLVPGQFLMLRLADGTDPLLGRPFAFYQIINDASGQPWAIDVVYLVVGKLTSRLATCKANTPLDIWGPLGNGFAVPVVEELIIVAGGIGQTPFLAVAQEALGQATFGTNARHVNQRPNVTILYGARNASYLAGVSDFEKTGAKVRISTDDGSAGQHGRVTDLLKETLAATMDRTRQVYCCGPEKMMEAVAQITSAAQVPCQVSLETPMACGIGICFSCVTPIKQETGGWDYRRTCVEGPVFDAESIVWHV
jgi:dihydroorotate dehydrogenase electron transfer subunit